MSNEIDWSKAPEGATHFHREVEGKFSPRWFMQVMGGWKVWYQGFWHTATLAASGIDVDDFVERPEPWTGQFLPPVGTICEFYDESSSVDWREGLQNGDKVKILAHYSPLGDGDMVAVFCYEIEGGKLTDQAVADCFRPIRTHEQIAAEERENAIKELSSIINSKISNTMSASAIYDAGYRRVEDK